MRSMISSPHRFVASGCAVACLLAVPVSALGEETDEFMSMDTLKQEDRTTISRSGTEIIQQIEAARGDIAAKRWVSARRNVSHARAIVSSLRSVSPAVSIQDKIARFFQDGSNDPDSLLPIYTELDGISDTDVVADVRANLDKAKQHLAAGDREAAGAELIEASSRVSYLEVDLPIESTYSRLNRAFMQLWSRDKPSADATLREALDHVRTFVAVASSAEDEALPAVGSGPMD